MKSLNLFNRIILCANLLFLALLLLSCLPPYIQSSRFFFLSVLSLAVPLLVLGNLLFLFYWMLLWKKVFWYTFLSLFLAYAVHGSFYEIRMRTEPERGEFLSLLSFNARGFDLFGERQKVRLEQEILGFISEEDPDILSFQEFDHNRARKFKEYPYQFLNSIIREQRHVQQAILSKYPIINKGSLNFPDSSNNAIFADIVYGKDTLRIYNLHLQSFQVIPSRRFLMKEASGKLFKRLEHGFIKQLEQAAILERHKAETHFSTIISGDLNNTQFSRVYRQVKGEMQDSFKEAGSGYGRTYNFRYYPLRIDFIFADPALEVVSHKNYNRRLSDHFPLLASFRIRKQ